MSQTLRHILLSLSATFALSSCMKYGPLEEEPVDAAGAGLFILCEGNFMYGNASLSYYNIGRGEVVNSAFSRANGTPLGDVAQSMTLHNGRGYVVVNNSGVIFVIDPETFRVIGTVTGLVSPRYIHFVSDSKAYITDLYSARIAILDPRSLHITGYIPLPGHPSAEQMVQLGEEVFVNCWSYDRQILVIDTATDRLADSVTVGRQPRSLALDRYGKLWTITDGGQEGTPFGHEEPALWRINATTRQIEHRFNLPGGDVPEELTTNGPRDTIYYINGGIWRMPASAETLPSAPIIAKRKSIFYGLAVDPLRSEIYVADAIDYVQPGIVYRFTPQGLPMDTIRVGITPGTFCFK